MRPETLVAIAADRLAHDSVNGCNHCLAAAPGVVAGQHVTAQGLMHKGLRGNEHLRLSAAKAVNALLRVTDDEDAGCLPARAPPCAAIP